MGTEALNLLNVVGFAGGVPDGLIAHEDLLIYPLGSTVVLRAKDSNESQEFLQGHTGQVSCLALSPSGRYLASGQETYLGAVSLRAC
jgi:cilia- and flagella-associated protein 52